MAVFSGLSQGQTKTINTVTLAGTVTMASTPVVTDNGTVKKTTQSLSSYRIGNREILKLMADNRIIPSVIGYSLVQKFQNDGTSIGYFARSTSGAEVAADPAIFGFTTVGSALSTNTTVTQPSIPSGTATTTGTITGKVLGTLSVDGTNCALLNTVTRTFGRTARLNNLNVRFTAVTSQGKLFGSFGPTGPVIDATIDSNFTKPVSDP
ncbi:MAG: hypothetical protein CFE26_11085 [Verrucomicrobiales bacterium VVV1]|nr:MAG: hypothetical protein CFE26_11085 [Verrucomicrobiales bacterium VVV1]